MSLRSALVATLVVALTGGAATLAQAPETITPLLPSPAPPAESVPAYDPRFMYNLAETSTAAPSEWLALYSDRENGEIFAVLRDTIRIFNRRGMETFSFPISREFGGAIAVAVGSNGDVYTIASSLGSRLVRYSFRGEPLGTVEITGAPEGALSDFRPSALAAAKRELYLADGGALRVVVVDEEGAFQRSIDIASMLGLQGQKRTENDMGGFSADADGNLLFTIPTMFRAFILAPDGSLRGFGVRGSARGKFNIAGPIAADDEGHVLVLDVLKAAILVFDENLKFVAQFGWRGWEREGLVAPRDLVTGAGKAFVAQSANRGVSVFRYSEWNPHSRDVAVVRSEAQAQQAVNPGPQPSQAAH